MIPILYAIGAGAFASIAWPHAKTSTEEHGWRVGMTLAFAAAWPILVPFIISCAIVEAARTRQG